MATNFFEAEVVKYERRVRKIRENPDPTKLKSNRLLYELELAQRKKWLQDWQDGKPFAYTMGGEDLLEVMGINCLCLSLIADRAGAYAPEYLRAARAAGFPENVCDRFQVAMGMISSGAVPRPSFVTGASGSCNIEMEMMVAAANLFNAPAYFIDRYIEPDEEPFPYLVDQFREMVQMVEKKVPGARKLDEKKVLENQDKMREAQKCTKVLYEAAQKVPCPVRGQDMFRITDPSYATMDGGLEYFHMVKEELEERLRKGIPALPNEKARAMWCVTGPFYDDALGILEKRGVAVPVFQWDMIPRFYGLGTGVIGDDQEFGKRLSPLEEYVRYFRMNCWSGPAEKWVQETIQRCREFKIDMLVYFQLSGCPTNLLSAKIVADRVEQELGLPILLIEGYMLDSEKYNRPEFEARLDEFVSMALARKRERG